MIAAMIPDPPFILGIDSGTSSTRAILFDSEAKPAASHAMALRQIYPANGWVEHDPEEIWQAALACSRAALKAAGDIAAIAITNQRETVLLWDRATGKALHNAIVWQDRRTAARCEALRRRPGLEAKIAAKTGLRLDPYFSATKLEWLLNHVPGARKRAQKGGLAFGTVDSWLIYKLTGGRVHATDITNASRTMLMNLKTLAWDKDLLSLFGVSEKLLPRICADAAEFGESDAALLGSPIPILGAAGDQQAASFGQVCFAPGDAKATFGTGCFVLVHTGAARVTSKNRMLTTVLYREKDGPRYAIEGSVFIAGAVVQWLRDELGAIAHAAEVEALARAAKPAEGLYFVPAFTGLGAPYWDAAARGAILGLTRDMGAAEIARAALDAVCYQTRDLLEAMARDMKSTGLKKIRKLKVDGAMAGNDWFCQRLADLTGLTVDRSAEIEATVLGVVCMAGLAAGLFRNKKDIAARWTLDRRFTPALKPAMRDALYEGWKAAIKKVRT
jgi:glycerol kinase